MKKIAIASIIALAATAASAMEIGVKTSRDYGSDRNTLGLTLGKKFDKVGVEGGFERTTVGEAQNRYSLTGSYDLATFNKLTVAAKAGVAYLDNRHSDDGYAVAAGVGVSYPLTDKVSLTADFMRQAGQTRVQQFDGNRFTVGAKYSF